MRMTPHFEPHPMFTNDPHPRNTSALPLPTPAPLPRPSGEGGPPTADRMGSPSQPASPALAGEVPAQQAAGASPSSPDGQSLVASPLFSDLLDPTNTPLQICLIHDITLDQLEAIVTSTAFKRAAAQLQTITSARTDAIESNTHLQTQSLNRAIAQDAYLAATEMDQAATTRDPKRAAIKARYLETARKANTPLGARTRGKAAQCGEESTPPNTQHQPPQPASPARAEEVVRPRRIGGRCLPNNQPHPLSSPALAGEVPTKSAEGVFLPTPPPNNPKSTGVHHGATLPLTH